jgi:hypothetical protein
MDRVRGNYSSVGDTARLSIQDQVLQQAIDIERLNERVAAIDRNQSDSLRLLEKILQANTDVANHLAALDAKLGTHMDDVARRFAEQRKDLGDICTLRHEQVDRRFEGLERKDERVGEQIQQMGEITKIRYIKQLQAELKKQDVQIREKESRQHGWRKYWVSTVVGLVAAIITAFVTSLFGGK